MGDPEIIHCEMNWQKHLLKIIINKRQSPADRDMKKSTSNHYRNDFKKSGTGRKAGIL